MRYTEKENKPLPHYASIDISKDLNEIIQKLGQLEDIEEELGIDLITLFKALKNGAYDLNCSNKPRHCSGMSIQYYNNEWYLEHIESGCFCERLKDYGKTWALTKEELDNV